MARKFFDTEIATHNLDPAVVIAKATRRGAKVDDFNVVCAWNNYSIDIVEEVIAEMIAKATPAPAPAPTTTAARTQPTRCGHYDVSNTGECYACGTYLARHDVGRYV